MSVRLLFTLTCMLATGVVSSHAVAFAPPPCTTDQECLDDELGYFNMCQIELDEDEGFCTVDFPSCSSDQECLDQGYDSCDETLGECTWEWWGESDDDDAGGPPACQTDAECHEMGYEFCGDGVCGHDGGVSSHYECQSDEACGEGYTCEESTSGSECVPSTSAPESSTTDASGADASQPEGGDDNENWCESDADCPNGLVCREFSSDSSCVSVGGDTSGCHGGQSPHGLLVIFGGLAFLVTRRGRGTLAGTQGGPSP